MMIVYIYLNLAKALNMKIQTPQLVIPAKAGTQSYLWYKTVFYHSYDMIVFLNVSLGSCLRRNDNRGQNLGTPYIKRSCFNRTEVK
jgi:hypothetical protein